MNHSIPLSFRGVPWIVLGLRMLWMESARAASPDAVELFEQRIRPILANECYECHGAKKQKAGLRVASLQTPEVGRAAYERLGFKPAARIAHYR